MDFWRQDVPPPRCPRQCRVRGDSRRLWVSNLHPNKILFCNWVFLCGAPTRAAMSGRTTQNDVACWTLYDYLGTGPEGCTKSCWTANSVCPFSVQQFWKLSLPKKKKKILNIVSQVICRPYTYRRNGWKLNECKTHEIALTWFQFW